MSTIEQELRAATGHDFLQRPLGDVDPDIADALRMETARQNDTLEPKPHLSICGATAYPRVIDFKRSREICDKSGALMMADIAHIAGLVVADLHPSPVPHADFVTSTTHKTLRGPRAGLILCKEKYAKDLDRSVFPGIQGAPLVHI